MGGDSQQDFLEHFWNSTALIRPKYYDLLRIYVLQIQMYNDLIHH